MAILEMSLSASVLILAVVIIRALALHRLPKKTFLVFWGVALCRLLIPFSIPSRFSVYTLADMLKNRAPTIDTPYIATTMPDIITAAGGVTNTPLTDTTTTTVSVTASPIMAVWMFGLLACALFFLVTHFRCRREYKTALPIDNELVKQWLSKHPTRRKVQILQSDKIAAPLTYGIFRPVVLLPKTTDWADETRLRYILAHEFVHIRRFDTLTKLVLAAALCVHWFNPLVWVMYILANRDIELSCDETVVRTFGETIKSAYALTLIGLEEKKSRLTPLVNNFSKNAIEERITAIMEMKKTSLMGIILALVLIVGITTAFATSAAHTTKENDRIGYSNESIEKIVSQSKNSWAVESVTESGAFFNSYEEIKPGENVTFGGYALHKGDLVNLDYSYSGSDLMASIFEYSDVSFLDGKTIENKSSYTIPNNGNYYFIIQSPIQNDKSSEDVEIKIQIDLAPQSSEQMQTNSSEYIMAETIQPYLQYGVTNDNNPVYCDYHGRAHSNWWFNQKRISIFQDGDAILIYHPNDDGFPNSTAVKVIRDSNNKIKKIAEMTKSERNEVIAGINDGAAPVAAARPESTLDQGIPLVPASESIPLAEGKVYKNLTKDGTLEAKGKELNNYQLFTNSEEISVSIPKGEYKGEFVLYDALRKVDIQQFTLDGNKRTKKFTNLSALDNYYIVVSGIDDVNVTVSD